MNGERQIRTEKFPVPWPQMCHARAKGAAATHRSHFHHVSFCRAPFLRRRVLSGEAFNEKLSKKRR
jgi:hypothetical protein